MLNPPLSVLSEDLLGCIVEHVAKLSSRDRDLQNLSLSDRAFTHFCQKYLFQTLRLNGFNGKISRNIEKAGKILKDNPSLAKSVRVVQLSINNQNKWLCNDPILIGVFQLIADSPRPPHELYVYGYETSSVKIEDPILIVERFAQSFFSETLTTLSLLGCKNVPLPFLIICPQLVEVKLDQVAATKQGYDDYPDELCSGRKPPALEIFNYRRAHSLVSQMISPPPRFSTPLVLWSSLRVLTLSPHEKKEMACLQSILDAACNTLEELFLTRMRVADSYNHLPLAPLINLRNISNLRVFALYLIVKCHSGESTTLRDVNVVLDTIPASNQVSNLFFDIKIYGKHPFRECLDQDWVGLCDQVIRISNDKLLELDLQTLVKGNFNLRGNVPGEHVLYSHIMEKMTVLSEYPQICTHFWNPGDWQRGCSPSPRDQVRSGCK